MRVRRFNGNPYRLIGVSRHRDKKGKTRNPEQTREEARQLANKIRQRGYNARVVDWVGGSGLYIGRRKYFKTKAEARRDWLDSLAHKRFEDAVFNSGLGMGSMFSVEKMNVGDDPAEEKWGFRIGERLDVGDKADRGMPQAVIAELDEQKAFDFSLAEIPNQISFGGAVVGNERAIGSEYAFWLQENVLNSGSSNPGWGIGTIERKEGQRFGNLNPSRRRYHVVVSFNNPDDNGDWGEIPLYAFATQEQADRFKKRLMDDIEDKGYLFISGKEALNMEGFFVYNPYPVEIPIERLELSVVPENADLAADTREGEVGSMIRRQRLNLAGGQDYDPSFKEEYEDEDRPFMQGTPANPSLRDVIKESQDREIDDLEEIGNLKSDFDEAVEQVQCPSGGLGCECVNCSGSNRITARCARCFSMQKQCGCRLEDIMD